MCVSHKYAPPPTEGEGNIVFLTDPVGMSMTTRYLKNLLADFDQIFLDVLHLGMRKNAPDLIQYQVSVNRNCHN